MGTDITFAVERRDPVDGWVRAERVLDGPRDPFSRPLGHREAWYDARNYGCFFLLAGVPSPRPVGPADAVIHEARGFPQDAGAEVVEERRRWDSDGVFGDSWLSALDLVAYDWQQPVTNSYMATRPSHENAPTLTDGRKSNRMSDDEVRDWVAEWGVPPPGWGRAGDSRDGVRVYANTTPAELAREFLPVVLRIAALSPDDLAAARCVFWFDR